MSQVLDVKILNSNNNRQAVEDLVQAFVAAGKVTTVNLGPNFIRYEAQCPLSAENTITDDDLSQLRGLGAAANVRRLVP